MLDSINNGFDLANVKSLGYDECTFLSDIKSIHY